MPDLNTYNSEFKLVLISYAWLVKDVGGIKV